VTEHVADRSTVGRDAPFLNLLVPLGVAAVALVLRRFRLVIPAVLLIPLERLSFVSGHAISAWARDARSDP